MEQVEEDAGPEYELPSGIVILNFLPVQLFLPVEVERTLDFIFLSGINVCNSFAKIEIVGIFPRNKVLLTKQNINWVISIKFISKL